MGGDDMKKYVDGVLLDMTQAEVEALKQVEQQQKTEIELLKEQQESIMNVLDSIIMGEV